ncbi:MAG: RNA methyltransferase [Lachnospiraceae bacterium]|nr:RNA methyltransferase [Lachnospiraceae bacterium]
MITSASNQKIKNLISIIQKSKARREQDVFITEGVKMFQEAPMDKIVEVYVAESFYETGTAREKIQQCGYEILSDELFKKVSDTQTPQGILCVMKQYHYELEDLFQKENPLFLILEDIQDPGNLGTMIRTAEGAGVDGIIMTKGTVDIYNPKTIRSTMGSVYRMLFIYTDDLLGVMKQLQEKQVKLYAAHLKGNQFYHQLDFKGATAFLIGNEGNGLKDETADAADVYMKIPMEGKVESLNAAVASVILMYEAARQRMS